MVFSFEGEEDDNQNRLTEIRLKKKSSTFSGHRGVALVESTGLVVRKAARKQGSNQTWPLPQLGTLQCSVMLFYRLYCLYLIVYMYYNCTFR